MTFFILDSRHNSNVYLQSSANSGVVEEEDLAPLPEVAEEWPRARSLLLSLVPTFFSANSSSSKPRLFIPVRNSFCVISPMVAQPHSFWSRMSTRDSGSMPISPHNFSSPSTPMYASSSLFASGSRNFWKALRMAASKFLAGDDRADPLALRLILLLSSSLVELILI